MSTYRIGTAVLDLDNPADRAKLEDLHSRRARLLCECVHPPLEMYLARAANGILVKRMPGTGSAHAPGCPSYEPPAELSGIAGLLGTAILEDADNGTTILRLGFPMTKRGPQPAPSPGTGQSDTAKADTKKMTLRGLLHYLWEEARLNHWDPRWAGKRNWRVIHAHLSDVASSKTTATDPLSQTLFVPEPFNVDHKDEIAHRRRTNLARMSNRRPGQKNYMIVIGEVKEIATSRAGFKIVMRHLPDFHFGMPIELHARFRKKFETDIALWDKDPNNHLVVAATFSMNAAGYATIEELTAMATNSNWIPIENGDDERRLVQILTDEKRAFLKVLRYGLPASRPTATAVLTDARPKPVTLYILPPEASDDYRTALRELVDGSDFLPWFWQPIADDTLKLPPITGYAGMRFPVTKPAAA